MIQGELYISTTWAASTSFIPFAGGMLNAQDSEYQGTANRGQYGTTAYISGLWESQVYEDAIKEYYGNNANRRIPGQRSAADTEFMYGMGGFNASKGNAYLPGTVIETKVRKLKALKASPNRSGIQVNTQLVKGNKLLIKYIGKGELVRP